MRCSTSAPTMAFRSVGSHQRITLFLSTALAFSFSFIQPSVIVERRRLPSVGKASSIDTPKRVRHAQEGASVAWTKHGLGLLRNVAKPKGVDNPTSDDTFCALPPISAPLRHFSPSSPLVYGYWRLGNDMNSELRPESGGCGVDVNGVVQAQELKSKRECTIMKPSAKWTKAVMTRQARDKEGQSGDLS
ncbi:hypothetical protein EDB83DRAFT_2552020 [Lactarius deliciosus]|nr:hypothetical protein EDB83DRAFT_2552020 [Lactarius deliciosus]